MPGTAVASSSSVQLPAQQPQRRVAPAAPASANYMAMPRRVPVPVQRASAILEAGGVQGGYSDPVVARQGLGMRREASGDEDDEGGIVVDVVPEGGERGYKVQTVKPGGKGANERRRRTGRRKS